jgi:MFS family permease
MGQSPTPDSTYSWIVVTVGAIALVFTLGTPFSYGIFLGPLGDAYGLSSVAISLIFSIHLFAAYSVAGILGVIATRVAVRRVFLATGGVTALIAPGLYVIDSFLGLVLLFTVLGAALGLTVVMIISVVPQWFEARRGVATGGLFVGIGLSLFVLPPTWNLAFASMGVQAGFFTIIGVSALSFFVAGVVCQHPPWIERSVTPLSALGVWISQLIRTRQFHYLLLGFAFAFTWFYLLAGFGVDYFEYRGLDRAVATVAFGFIGGISIAARLASGALADRLGYGRTYLLSLACALVGCLLLVLPGLLSIYAAIIFFGLSLGGVTTLYVPIALRIYDPEKSTAIVGIFTSGLGITALAAPPMATTLVSSTGSFLPVILLTAVTVLIAGALIWLGAVAGSGSG